MRREYTREELTAMRTEILDRGITIQGLAKAAGVQESLIIEIMKGRLRPTLQVRKDLAKALFVNPELLS